MTGIKVNFCIWALHVANIEIDYIPSIGKNMCGNKLYITQLTAKHEKRCRVYKTSKYQFSNEKIDTYTIKLMLDFTTPLTLL